MNQTPEQLARRSERWTQISWGALLVGGALSLWCWHLATQSVRETAREELVRVARDHAEQLQMRVAQHAHLLQSFQAAYTANPQLDRRTFHQLYQSLVSDEYGGLQAIQLARLVKDPDKAAFIAQTRADRSLRPEGNPDFQIRPEGQREHYLPVVFVEPAARNPQVLGFDQALDPIRREVMAQARDAGQVRASGPVRLESGARHAVGFVLRMPLYHPQMPTHTVEQRRAAFVGHAGAAVEAAGLARQVMPPQTWSQWHWRLDDIGPADGPVAAATLLFDSGTVGHQAAFVPQAQQATSDHLSTSVQVAGRRWQSTLSQPPLQAPWQPLPLAVLIGGLLSTLGLWWALRGMGQQQAESATLARALSRDALETARQLKSVMDSTQDAILTVNEMGSVMSLNQAARQLLGGGASLDGSCPPIQHLLPPAPHDPSLPSDSFQAFMAAQGLSLDAVGHRLMLHPIQGEPIPVEVTVNALQGGDSAQYVLTARDLRSQLAAESAYQVAQRQLDEVDEMRRVIVHHAPYAIMVLNRSGVIQAVNPAGEALLGYPAHELIGRSTTQRFFDPDEVAAQSKLLALRLNHPVEDMQVLSHLAKASPGVPTEWTLLRADGRRIVAELSVTLLSDESTQMTGYLAMAHDVTSRTEAEQRLQHQAQHDALTGLPNRHMVQEQLKAAVTQCEREGKHLALMFLDMDRFKKINDTLGHHVGDNVIVEIAQRLRAGMRTSDIVARLGGDEFVVLLPQISQPSDGEMVAQKVMDLFDEPVRMGPHELRITPSIGLVVYPTHGADAGTLMRHADLAMYQAKNQGRNRVQLYNPQLEATTEDTLVLENELYKALERDELRLHFQPQFDCASGLIIGAEALLRWEHNGKLVAPMDFIPFAEETGLIVPMGEWVLRRACEKAHLWRTDTGWPLRMAVNLSAVQLDRTDIVETVARALVDTGLDPTALELEITETVVVRESLRAADILTQMRALGVSVAIDDFGVGYSSFGYLRELPVDRFKLDRSFLSAIPQSEGDCRLAAALIAMAHRLEVGIVAEGVETAEQFAFLKAHNCNEAQGYFLGRPLKEDAFEALLREHAAQHPEVRIAPETSTT